MASFSSSSSYKRMLQLYSGNRNRCLYPLPASFTVPFASVLSSTNNPIVAADPVCNGAIDFEFTLYGTAVPFVSGVYAPGSDQHTIYVNYDFETFENAIFGYYVGFKMQDVASNEVHVIRSYDPSSQMFTLDRPFQNPIVVGNVVNINTVYPTSYSIFLPTQDILGNILKKSALAYNGYYVVFETNRPEYSNEYNSNILSRRISYYDSIQQIAYFEEKLPFEYGTAEEDFQTYTLRKEPPQERWTLSNPSYYNMTPPANPEIGPALGPVVVLPVGANTTDNFYKNRYIYVYSNSPQTYSPPLPSQTLLAYPIPGIFYPIYGLFLITAYNGSTRECSVQQVCVNEFTKSELPTYASLPEYSSASFFLQPDSNFSSIVYMGGTTYRAYLDLSKDFASLPVKFAGIWINIAGGKPYTFSFRARRSLTILGNGEVSGWFRTSRSTVEYNATILYEYETFNFSVSINADATQMGLEFACLTANNVDPAYIEWDLFTVARQDTINILNFNHDNFSPLDYIGTMVSTQQVICYELTVLSLTLPNKLLLTGSRIAFYPYVYIEIQNVTSASSAAYNLITSNNPHSTRAVFHMSVPQVSDPENQAFVTLTGSGTQIMKFKPNDNLKFAVYLSDGTLFQTLAVDLFPPYAPDPQLQVDLLLNLTRIS